MIILIRFTELPRMLYPAISLKSAWVLQAKVAYAGGIVTVKRDRLSEA